MIVAFFLQLNHYLLEVVPYLFLGFLLSGVVHEFLSGDLVKKHLGEKGLKPLLYATILGTILPICCIGSLPVAVSMHKKGARLGAVLAFLVATPATSLSALVVCLALLGAGFTVFLFFAVIVMGIVIGVAGNMIPRDRKDPPPPVCPHKKGLFKDPVCGMSVDECGVVVSSFRGRDFYFCSTHCLAKFQDDPGQYLDKGEKRPGIKKRVISVLLYAFVEMPREMGLEILVGLCLAALIASVAPVGRFIGNYFHGPLAYPFGLLFGLLMYICSTASVPLVQAFISQGMNVGAGMVLLMVGPVTSLGTILVLRKEFGIRILLLYLVVICAVSVGSGILFTLVF